MSTYTETAQKLIEDVQCFSVHRGGGVLQEDRLCMHLLGHPTPAAYKQSARLWGQLTSGCMLQGERRALWKLPCFLQSLD